MKLKSFCVNCDVFSCLFPLNVQSWMQLLSRVVCACQSRKSDFGWHHLAWCVKELKSLKRSWPYLAAFRSCISNGKPEQLLYLMFVLFHCCCCCFFSNFMKQVERSLCGYFIHVCKIIRNDLCKRFTELYLFYWLLVVSLPILMHLSAAIGGGVTSGHPRSFAQRRLQIPPYPKPELFNK